MKYHYFVEGQCEKVFLKTLMFCDEELIKEGKIDIFNFVGEIFPSARATTIAKDTVVVIVFDADAGNPKLLKQNIDILNKRASSHIKDIVFVISINNFEEELVYSTNLKTINDMFKTKSISEFKTKLLRHDSLNAKLKEIEFDINKIWSRQVTTIYKDIKNCGYKIKKKK